MSKYMTPISVIITTYNRSNLLERAIDSCLVEIDSESEIIVIDDASTDGTFEFMSSIDAPNVKYIRQKENSGKMACINAAKSNVKNNFISFLDDDDYWVVGRFDQIQKQIIESKDPRLSILYSPVIIKTKNQNSIRPKRAKFVDETYLNYIINGNGLIQHSSIVISRDLFSVMFLDPNIRKHIDYELCQQAEYHGAKFEMAETPLVTWDCSNDGARLSHSGPSGSEQWFDKWHSLLPTIYTRYTKKAFIAFHHAPLLAKTHPNQALRMLIEAMLAGYISPRLLLRALRRFING